MKSKCSKIKTLKWAAAVVLVLYGANYMFTPEYIGITKLETYFRPKVGLQFDSSKWKQSQELSWGERYKMVDNLIQMYLIKGRSQHEIEDLLGKPDIAAPRENGEFEMHYTLASQREYPARSVFFPGRLGNLELWVLLLHFRDGRLYSVEVVPA